MGVKPRAAFSVRVNMRASVRASMRASVRVGGLGALGIRAHR